MPYKHIFSSYLPSKKGKIMKKTKMMKKNYEFKNILSKGKYYSGQYIEAFIKKGSIKDINLLGIAISTKVAKASRRNQIKRLIRENYYFYENFLKTGYQIIFLWKKSIGTEKANYQNIHNDMNNILKKASIIEEEI